MPGRVYKCVTQEDTLADLSAIKSRQQAAWATGDYAAVGSAILLSAELLAEALDLRSGSLLLDVAAGHGNMSLAAARRGCRVTSTDFVPALLERGKARAEVEGWRIEFQEADAENLPFADGAFDYVVSTFGVMFTPDQPRAASELMRVCRKGGKIGLANWTPRSFVGQIFTIIGKYVAPASGLLPPSLWGTEARLAELFPGVANMQIAVRASNFRSRSEKHWLDHFRTWYGPMQRTFAALDPEQQTALEQDLLALARGLNRAEDGTMVLPSEYLEVAITR